MDDWLTTIPAAHRGLHGQSDGIVENSLSAFAAAKECGYAIELDVQLSADHDAMVFHDGKLDRLTGQQGLVSARTSGELREMQLTGSTDHIPNLQDVLSFIDGAVPLLIELKTGFKDPGPLEAHVLELLTHYTGEAVVMSFNHKSVRWFLEQGHRVRRGQLSYDYKGGGGGSLPFYQRFWYRNLLQTQYSKPDFIGYDIRGLPCPGTMIARAMGIPVLSWTVRTDDERARARLHADNIIFETFKPTLGRSNA